MIFLTEMFEVGAGFVRVPHPRKYAMPRSKKIENDPEDAELYSVSMTHQLHCLAVLRHVIIKYEKGDKSRFAGAGHEYHCIDYSMYLKFSPFPSGVTEFIRMGMKVVIWD
jgi:hypothetical protein